MLHIVILSLMAVVTLAFAMFAIIMMVKSSK